MMSWRTRRIRSRSTCASANRRTRSFVSGLSLLRTSSSTTTSTSVESAGSSEIGAASPCLLAFFAARALPQAVLGPVLDRAFIKFARRFAALAFILRSRLDLVRRLGTRHPRLAVRLGAVVRRVSHDAVEFRAVQHFGPPVFP